jgi:hypothetical protein
VVEVATGVAMAATVVFVAVDASFGLRETGNRIASYAAPTGRAEDDQRTRRAIRFRIGVLLRPRDGKGAIGGDRTGPLIEAGLLYGRLALLEERRGEIRAAAQCMAEGVALLKSAGHPRPTETEIRRVIAQQDARAATR